MARKTAAAVAAFLFGVGGLVGAQEPVREAPPQIVVNGRGEVRVVPDVATVTIGVQTRANTAAEATAENSKKQLAVVNAIKAKGVAAAQISTSGFSVQPETVYDQRGQAAPKTTGYLVSNMVTVELKRTEQVGPVIDGALAAGANQIHGLSFSVSSPDSARRAALAQAVQNARQDAEVAARAAGGTLGQLIEIIATEYQVPFLQAKTAGFAMRSMAEAAPPVEAGTTSVSASVSARWRFQAGPPR
jgi:uncharacterized protein YggE